MPIELGKCDDCPRFAIIKVTHFPSEDTERYCEVCIKKVNRYAGS